MHNNQSYLAPNDIARIIHAGDVILTENPDGIGKPIKFFQELAGDKAVFTHAAIASAYQNRIYEANNILKMSLLSDYKGKRICIIRHKEMTDNLYTIGFNKSITPNIGKRYPYARLVLFAIDSLSNYALRKLGFKFRMKTTKWLSLGRMVCSEWVADFFVKIGLMKEREGVVPDDFHDWAEAYAYGWSVIADGILVDDKYL